MRLEPVSSSTTSARYRRSTKWTMNSHTCPSLRCKESINLGCSGGTAGRQMFGRRRGTPELSAVVVKALAAALRPNLNIINAHYLYSLVPLWVAEILTEIRPERRRLDLFFSSYFILKWLTPTLEMKKKTYCEIIKNHKYHPCLFYLWLYFQRPWRPPVSGRTSQCVGDIQSQAWIFNQTKFNQCWTTIKMLPNNNNLMFNLKFKSQ